MNTLVLAKPLPSCTTSFLIPLIGGHPTSASTVDGERLLSPESQSLEFWSGYAHSRALYRGIVNLWSIYYNGSTLLLPWSCLSSTSSDQPLLCPQCLGGENSLRHRKRPFLSKTDVLVGEIGKFLGGRAVQSSMTLDFEKVNG